MPSLDRSWRLPLLVADFERYLRAFEEAPPFARRGQLEFHLQTIALRRRHDTVAGALDDPTYLHSLYRTLQAWGIGVRGSRLVPFEDFVGRLRLKEPELSALAGLSIDEPFEVTTVSRALWSTIETLGIIANNTPIVSGTKTLHHILPDLVVPMDRAYTQRFFGWHSPEFQYGQREFFSLAFGAFARLAREVQPERFVGEGWNSSRTKVIDNAIVGILRLEQQRPNQRLVTLCDEIISEFVRSREPSALQTGVDEDPATLVRGLQRVLLARSITHVKVVQHQGDIYLVNRRLGKIP